MYNASNWIDSSKKVTKNIKKQRQNLLPRTSSYSNFADCFMSPFSVPIGSMYGIYANIWGILMGSMLPYIAYMDPFSVENLNINKQMAFSSAVLHHPGLYNFPHPTGCSSLCGPINSNSMGI